MSDNSSRDDEERLSALPSEWIWAKLSDICFVQGGFAFKSRDYQNEGIPLIRISNINNDKVNFNGNSIYLNENIKESFRLFLVRKGDIVIALSGYPGKFGVYDQDFFSLLNQRVGRLQFYSKHLVNPKYVLYYMNILKKFIIRKSYGMAQLNISTDEIAEFHIPFPPLPEQHRVVIKIEELFTQLDAGVASLNKVQAQLKRYRQAVLKAAFEGRLTLEWREEHKGEIEPASVLFEKIKREYHRDEKKIAKRLPLVEAELFQVPEEWIWVQAQDVCENITNGYTPAADKLFEGSGEIPFIKVYNLTRTGALDFAVKPTFISRVTHEMELRRSAVYPQDVLMNIVGPPLGKVSLVPELHGEWNINQAIVIYRTFPEYSRKLMLYALLSETIQKWLQKRGKTTAGQTNYTITMSRSLPIPLPSLNEQSLIVNEIERHFSQIDHLEKTVETSLSRAETLRQSILKRAFKGKLVPQNPADEPASVLLERIKTEKASHTAEVKKGKKVQPKSPKRKIKNGN